MPRHCHGLGWCHEGCCCQAVCHCRWGRHTRHCHPHRLGPEETGREMRHGSVVGHALLTHTMCLCADHAGERCCRHVAGRTKNVTRRNWHDLQKHPCKHKPARQSFCTVLTPNVCTFAKSRCRVTPLLKTVMCVCPTASCDFHTISQDFIVWNSHSSPRCCERSPPCSAATRTAPACLTARPALRPLHFSRAALGPLGGPGTLTQAAHQTRCVRIAARWPVCSSV